jgi:hypothetical protein
MAKQSHKNQPVQGVAPVQGEAVAQENMTMEDVARELVMAFEMECKAAHEKARGQSLPYKDIVWAVDTLLDAVGADRGAVSVLEKKVPLLLAAKYKAMGDATNLVSVKIGSVIKQMPSNELRKLREGQLAHMQDPKVKDNFYRRIYGLGFRKEFKRFELDNGDLVRKAKPTTEGAEAPQA